MSFVYIAAVYQAQGEYATAIEYFDKSLLILVESQGQEELTYSVFQKMAELLTKLPS